MDRIRKKVMDERLKQWYETKLPDGETVKEFEDRIRPRSRISKMGMMLGLAFAINALFPCTDGRYSEEAKRHASDVAQQVGWEWADVDGVANRPGAHPCEAGELAYRIWGINPKGNYSHGTVCCSLENIGDCPAVYDE